ncbi:MAG: porin family protein [Bacteroidota bacterium]
MRSTIPLLIIALLIVTDLSGQSRSRKRRVKFKKGFELQAMAGVNLSQIDGDLFQGFDQTGLNAGVQVNALLAPSIGVNVGMMFSQKGSRTQHLSPNPSPRYPKDRNLRLNYVEIPVTLKLALSRKQTRSFFEVGGTVSRLFSNNIEERELRFVEGTSLVEISPEFESTDINALAGFGYDIGEHISLIFRYQLALTSFYENPDLEPGRQFIVDRTPDIEFMRNYNISFLIGYRI